MKGKTFNNYEDRASETMTYDRAIREMSEYKLREVSNMSYAVMGLTGEAGEVANAFKKVIRDHQGVVSAEVRDDIVDELGDVLWYVTAIAHELGFTLEEVAIRNNFKLEERYKNGKQRTKPNSNQPA